MKKTIRGLVCLSLFFCSAGFSSSQDDVDIVPEQTRDLYHTGSGAQDATYNTIGRSMWAWGIGLAAVIGILASAIHQSNTTTTTQ
jgi:hypothetical protein